MTDDAPSAPTDEEIGAAIRKIARAAGHDESSFAWFANRLIRDVDQFSPENMPTRVGLVHDGPPDAIDGPLERVLEFLTNAPTSVAALPKAQVMSRMSVAVAAAKAGS